jgi:hypothetical protein
MKKTRKQIFNYARLIAKSAGLIFALVGILLFMIQFIPEYWGPGLVVFMIGGFLWSLDTLWSTLDSWLELSRKITDNGNK